MVLTPQNVANSPTNSYPVAKFNATIDGKLCEIQGVALVDSAGAEYTALNPFPTNGTFTGSVVVAAQTAATATENTVTVDSTAGGTEILATNSSRKSGRVRVAIAASQIVHVAFGAVADANSRAYAPGEIIELVVGNVVYQGPIFAFVSSGSEPVEYTVL